MKKLVLIFFGFTVVVILVSLFNKSQNAPAQAAAQEATEKAFGDAVTSTLKLRPKWNGIQVDEATGHRYSLTLNYKAMPSNQSEVEHDTHAVVQAVLDTLVKQGHHPAQEFTRITVQAIKPEKGATGQSVARVFGYADYDYNNDSITYSPKN